jgi:hypothetical protein
VAVFVNLLPIGQQGYESGITVGNYYVSLQSTVLSSAATSYEGVRAVRSSNPVVGVDNIASTLQTPTSSMAPVTAGATYTASMFVYGSAAITAHYIRIYWFQSSGAASSVTAFSESSSFGALSTTYTNRVFAATAPSDAAYASVGWRNANGNSTGNFQYCDALGLYAGTLSSSLLAGAWLGPLTGDESAGSTDDLIAVRNVSSTLNDASQPATNGDSLASSAGVNPTADSAGSADALGTATSFAVTLNDTSSVIDSPLITYFLTVSGDPAGSSDALGKSLLPIASDSAGSADSLANSPSPTVSDTAAGSDSIGVAYSLAATDSAGSSDSRLVTALPVIADIVGSTDLLATVKGFNLTIDDQSPLTDMITAIRMVYLIENGDVGSSDLSDGYLSSWTSRTTQTQAIGSSTVASAAGTLQTVTL